MSEMSNLGSYLGSNWSNITLNTTKSQMEEKSNRPSQSKSAISFLITTAANINPISSTYAGLELYQTSPNYLPEKSPTYCARVSLMTIR